jgi:Polyketide cyclase / dehydrase and lipid transport
MKLPCLASAVALLSAPAAAEVKSVADSGFAISNRVTVKATPAQAYAALAKPGFWWDSAHTYSGDAKNLTMVIKPGGCFCEGVPADGSLIEHGRVVYAQPGKILRIHGALGPLQQEGVTGPLTWELKPSAEGGTEIINTYVVGGYIRGGTTTAAPLVDMVLGEQLARLKAYLDR